MNQQELWQAVLAQVQLEISHANFATWFQETNIILQDKNSIIVSVPSSFAKEWLEQKYNKSLRVVPNVKARPVIVGRVFCILHNSK